MHCNQLLLQSVANVGVLKEEGRGWTCAWNLLVGTAWSKTVY
jgi:hypothetical protein